MSQAPGSLGWTLAAASICPRAPMRAAEAAEPSRAANPKLWGLAEACAKELSRSRPLFDGKPCLAIRKERSLGAAAWMLAASMEDWAFCCMDPANPEALDMELFAECGFSALASSSGLKLEPSIHRPWPAGCEYAAFTSGSGGRPKCAMLPFGALARVARAQAELFGYGDGLRCGWCLSPGWDASLSDVFAPLAAGAALEPFEGASRDFFKLRSWLRGGIDAVDLPVSYLPLLAPEAAPRLRRVVYGGSLAKAEAIERWAAAGCRLFNCYGPTEAAICASSKAWSAGDDPRDIGSPIAGARLHLSSRGELAVSGPGAMLGYRLERDGSPLLDIGGQRAYPCADLASMEGGRLLFHGRLARSRKIDGFFVNPELLEQALLKSGLEAGCILRERKALCFCEQEPADPKVFMERLACELPRHLLERMVLRSIGKLPRLSNGKIDLRALEELP